MEEEEKIEEKETNEPGAAQTGEVEEEKVEKDDEGEKNPEPEVADLKTLIATMVKAQLEKMVKVAEKPAEEEKEETLGLYELMRKKGSYPEEKNEEDANTRVLRRRRRSVWE